LYDTCYFIGMPTDIVHAAEVAIEARGLTKRYGAVEALRGVDLRVRRGEIFAFLGPNGAGKTTTLEILEGFQRPTAGEVSVLGVRPADAGRRWRERVGVVMQSSHPEPGLTVREALELYAGYYTRPLAVDETLALVGLGDRAGALAERLSGGERRRLDVALALVGDPDLLFLDEPTTGFDPSARRSAWSMIDGLRALGKTVFLTTHYMEEAERLADRLAVIVEGKVVREGAPGTLGGRDRQAAHIRFTLPEHTTARELPAALQPARVGPGRTVAVRSESPLADLRTLADWALERGLDLPDLDVRRPMLEDVYLMLTRGDEEED
jgi:ABC-2 type transport system ATP-binding protein